MKRLALAALFLAMPPAFADEQPTALIEQARATIAKGNSDWLPAMQKHDAKTIAEIYDEHALFITPTGETIVGREAIQRMYEERFKRPGIYLSGGVQQDGMAVEGQSIVEWGHAYYDRQEADGKTTKGGGGYVTIWRRGADGVWRIIRNTVL